MAFDRFGHQIDAGVAVGLEPDWLRRIDFPIER